MKEIIEKISSYNIFNYLFPGILFCVLIQSFTSIKLIQDEIVTGFVTYYFIGLIISRIGSLIIEPILKSLKIIRFANYREFVAQSKTDQKIELLSEVNNMYRTLLSCCLCIIIVKIYMSIDPNLLFFMSVGWIILLLMLIALFAFSFKKQTDFIRTRVENKEGK